MLTVEEQGQLQFIAKKSIKNGLLTGLPIALTENNLSTASVTLQSTRASFVTLMINQDLRGCIGSLNAHRSLIADVAANAFSSAFKDPRFTPLTLKELEKLSIEISVLTPLELMKVTNEQDLLNQLQPCVDGLLIDDGHHRATFLPRVWSRLPDPRLFLDQLKQKAGIPPNSWPTSIQCFRYQCDKFAEAVKVPS
ncbi:MAG: AmmeMemoRadiSam system protein A [Endozoicomonadaceae bacterium]|nr:AmmeMemoRadiSam system protein A [Endozoicomonadaceae bacterium]